MNQNYTSSNWKGKDKYNNPIIDMDGTIFPVLSEEEQKDPRYGLYLWIEKYDDQWYIKFGATRKTIWDRYSDACGTHLQQIYRWMNGKLWDKDFEELLHKKFHWAGNKEDNPLYSEEAYYVNTPSDVIEFIKTINHHVATDGKEIKEEIKTYYHKSHFESREEQKLFEEQFLNYIHAPNRKTRRFLMYAVCRFGKTATTLHAIIEKLKLKRILILSSKCDTHNSWYDDYHKWDFTKDYTFITKEDIQLNPELLKEDKLICWCSFQSGAKNFDLVDEDGTVHFCDIEEDAPWQAQICNTNWDIVIPDECHYGVDTPRSKKLVDKLLEKEPILLEISATPFKKILRGDYNSENTFTYTLIDEYYMHKDDPDYVPVALYHIDLMSYLKKIEVPLQLSPASKRDLLAKINNCYDPENENKFSWRAYFKQFTARDIGIEFTMLYEQHFCKTGKHCLIYTNTVAAGNKIVAGLNPEQFNIINVCGNNFITVEAINKELENSKLPVIIVSCGRDMTGVTFEYLTNVIFMGSVNSAEMYIQYGLRGKNKYPGRGNKPCAIYDLNAKSFLRTDAFKRLIITEAKLNKKTPAEIAKLYEAATYMLEWNEGNIFVEYNNFAEEFTKNFSHIDNNNECPYIPEISDDILLAIENNMADVNFETSASMEITHEQLKSAKELNRNKKQKHQLSAEELALKTDAERRKILAMLRRQLQTNIAYIPSFMKHHNIQTIEELYTDENKHKFSLWAPFDIVLLKLMSKLMPNLDWQILCENINTVKNSLSDDVLSWKYRGKIPIWAY